MYQSIFALVAAAVVFAIPVTAAEDKKPQWLFVQAASGAELLDEATLHMPVEREVFAFTDRPAREHRYLNAHEFVSLWSEGADSFAGDPPNAVLSWREDGEVREVEIELLGAEVGSHGRAIQYEISVEEVGTLAKIGQEAALYIDGHWFGDGDRQGIYY
jgi:hypothetical protein